MAESISTGSIPTKPPVIIPNKFAVPSFLLDVKPEGETDAEGSDEQASTQTPGAVVTDATVTYDQSIAPTNEANQSPAADSNMLSVPGTVSVVSQTVRFAADGKSVIDVVLDVEDVKGAVTYDVRVTK